VAFVLREEKFTVRLKGACHSLFGISHCHPE